MQPARLHDSIIVTAIVAVITVMPFCPVAPFSPALANAPVRQVTGDGRKILMNVGYDASDLPLYGPKYVVDLDTGAITSVTDSARALSGDGRYLELADGGLRDLVTGTDWHADLTSYGALFFPFFRAGPVSRHAEIYAISIASPEPSRATHLLIESTSGVVTVMDHEVTGISPSGRYIATGSEVIDRIDGRTVATAAADETLGPVADDGSFVRTGPYSARIDAPAEGRVLTLPHFEDSSYTAFDEQLHIALLRSSLPDLYPGSPEHAWVVDVVSGIRWAAPTPIFQEDVTSRLLAGLRRPHWVLSGDGDALVMYAERCERNPHFCHQQRPFVARDLRAKLVPPNYGLASLRSGGTGSVRVAGVGSIPAGASAAWLSLTVVAPAGSGFATVYPCTGDLPPVSNLNYEAGQIVPNAVLAGLDANGATCVYSKAATDVVVDVTGWTGPAYNPLVPQRLLDTRTVSSARTGGIVVVNGHTRSLEPVVVNVTATDAVDDAFVTVWPCGQPQPLTSSLNVAIGATVANLVVSAVSESPSGDFELCLYASRPMHLIVDLDGQLGDDALGYRAINPIRLLDTRQNEIDPLPRLDAEAVTAVPVAIQGGAHVGDVAVLNLTGTKALAPGFVTVYPCGEPRPSTSNLNLRAGETKAVAVLAKVGQGGAVCLFNQQPVDLIVDLAGLVDASSPAHTRPFFGASPERIADTRAA